VAASKCGLGVMDILSPTAPFPGGLPGFISHVFGVLANTTSVRFTVDKYKLAPVNTEDAETGLSWHNYWHYGHWESCAVNAAEICNDQAEAGAAYLADAKKWGKPALVSEMGQFNCYCPAAHGWQAAGVGFIAWELVLEHDQFSSFQGLVYKNGTFRNQTERQCIADLASRTIRSCPPRPPPPPPSWCDAANCTFHADDDDTFFSWAPAHNPTRHCWNPWVGGPGTSRLKYCDIAHATVSFTLPGGTVAARLIFKKGPDCGIMSVSNGDNNVTVDTFSKTVQWNAMLPLDVVPNETAGASQIFVVSVTGEKNSAASHDWVQVVGVAIFKRPHRP
jgi:hypothetical protein